MNEDMRSLSRKARYEKRVKVIALRSSGQSYLQIALQLGLSRTGVFDICKRHDRLGSSSLHDAPGGRVSGQARKLSPEQEAGLRQQIIDSTPDEHAMPEVLWNRTAVSRLIEHKVGIVLPVRTLALYLNRWGFTAARPVVRSGHARSMPLERWLTHCYPKFTARSNAQGGDVQWGSDSPLPVEATRGPGGVAAAATLPRRARADRRGVSMISAVNNKGQLRWTTFEAPLDARILVAFLRRLIRGAGKKVFLIMDDWRVPDEAGLVDTWLVEHEDVIEAVHLPEQAPDEA